MIISQKSTKLLLSISAAALMIGCSTSIVERSPLDIASNSLRRTDSYSGASEVLAPQIKAFSSNRTSVKGEVQLRTAGPFTDSDGTVHRDGAYLEIVLDYVTATPDPDGGLYFDQANWAGGEAADLADFGAVVKDCREEAREIYRVPLGYTGYGHRGGHYGQYGRRGYGGYGYGRRGGHYGNRGRHGDGRYGDGRGGDGHHDGHEGGHDPGQGTDTPTSNNETNSTTRRGVTRRGVIEDRNRIPRERDPDRTTPRPRDNVRTGGTVGSALPPSRKQPRRRISDSTIKAEMSGRANRRSSSGAVSRPSPPKAAPAPRPSRPPVKRSSGSKKNTSKAVDRSFKNTNNSRTRTRADVNPRMRYDPHTRYNPGYSDYVVDYTCQRQETVSVFIPRERLLAAEKNGLLLYLRPRNGIEETVVLPPNYISGFLLAAYSPDGKRLAIEDGHTATAIKQPNLPVAAPEPEVSARTPIIYGGK